MKRMITSIMTIAALAVLTVGASFATPNGDCCNGSACCKGASCCHSKHHNK
jgi:hypothetical protein